MAIKSNSDISTFIRTTENRHVNSVQYLWNKLLEKGFIYKGYHEGWYSVSDESEILHISIYIFSQDLQIIDSIYLTKSTQK